jgi:uncharacterized SAM-binding protein YcdF (DUF218 family)
MFFAKKLISVFLLPSTLSLALILAGLLLLWLDRRVRLARLLLTGGFLLILLSSYRVVAGLYLQPLERRYPPLYPRPALEQVVEQAGKPIKWVVMLGGGHVLEAGIPANDQIGESALARLIESIRLQRELPGSKMLLSGGVGGAVKHADVLAAIAQMLGVPPESYVLDRTAWDTEQEANNLAHRIGSEPFVLVTSAVHMPRAMALFRKRGLRPIPAPTQHLTLDEPGVGLNEFFPSPWVQKDVDAATHEYIGMLWSRLRGRL